MRMAKCVLEWDAVVILFNDFSSLARGLKEWSIAERAPLCSFEIGLQMTGKDRGHLEVVAYNHSSCQLKQSGR